MLRTKGAANAAGLTPVTKDYLGKLFSSLTGSRLRGLSRFFNSPGLLGLLFQCLLRLAHSPYLTMMALTPFSRARSFGNDNVT
jgi:hypothetical protein